MAETGSEKEQETGKEHRPPQGAETTHELPLGGGKTLPYRAHAEWLVLRKHEEPHAEMFHVAYLTRDDDGRSPRPVTFVFNGGPGAASAFLHTGAMGPKRVVFREDGSPPPPPAELVDNGECWLPFTDLVFVDPIGTGYSRIIKEPRGSQAQSQGKDTGGGGASSSEEQQQAHQKREREYYELERDLHSLCEFIRRFLTHHKRWRSPVYIAGESYGGFRVAKLARKLQEEYGVGLNGTILISPALELISLIPSDYDVLAWLGQFPTLVASAHFHGRAKAFAADTPTEHVLQEAERFAAQELAPWLVQGEALDAERRTEIAERMEALTGISRELYTRASGRLPITRFVRELLRDQRRVCGLYDTTQTAIDPYPDRESHEAPDPTLWGIDRVFTAGIYALLGEVLGVESDRDYRLLSLEVNEAWRADTNRHAFERQIGATDDLRYAMALNPHMQVLMTHGIHDLVTPYNATERLLSLLKLEDSQRTNLHVKRFDGGHMFYVWDRSRREFRDFAAAHYHAHTERR